MNSVEQQRAGEVQRRDQAEAAFQQWWLQRDVQADLDTLCSHVAFTQSYKLYSWAFLSGVSFQVEQPIEALDVLQTDATRDELTRWVSQSSYRAALMTPYHAVMHAHTSVFSQAPPPTEAAVRHYAQDLLFALFRAGTRYAATGSAFRQDQAWSVPAVGARYE